MRRKIIGNSGDVFYDKCTQSRIALTAKENAPQVHVCDRCMVEVSQRLSNAKESATRNICLPQEEIEKNRMSSSGSRKGSGRLLKVDERGSLSNMYSNSALTEAPDCSLESKLQQFQKWQRQEEEDKLVLAGVDVTWFGCSRSNTNSEEKNNKESGCPNKGFSSNANEMK
ncbi:hypothetical protein Rs2_29283 [Raphanus sativus]|nr:hypothetical protein Rs2_29283 [Raphanus sativus]